MWDGEGSWVGPPPPLLTLLPCLLVQALDLPTPPHPPNRSKPSMAGGHTTMGCDGPGMSAFLLGLFTVSPLCLCLSCLPRGEEEVNLMSLLQLTHPPTHPPTHPTHRARFRPSPSR